MRSIARYCLAAGVAAAALLPALAQAKVRITVDLDAQTLHAEAAAQTLDFKISSGKAGYDTPVGKFNVLWMDKDHHSDEYEQAPMPNSIFFAPGFALHGFGKSPWGHKASHGCVRLPVAKSALLFELVKAEGAEITITGASPVTAATIQAKRREEMARTATAARDPSAESYQAERAEAQGYRAQGYGYGAVPAYAAQDVQDGRDGLPQQRPQPSGLRALFGSFY